VPALDDPTYQQQRDAFLAQAAQRESGNQNIPQRSGGPASGYFQIEDASRGGSGTWEDGARLAGMDISKWPRAMDAPYEAQLKVAQALYDQRGQRPWAASAPGGKVGPMATTDTPTAPAPESGLDTGTLNQLMAWLQPQAHTPAKGQPSMISLLGSALGGGGTGSVDMTDAQQESAGRRSLLNFGLGLLGSSGYSTTPKTMGEALAAGLGQAQQAYLGSEEMASQLLNQAQKNRLENAKSALTYLTAAQQNKVAQGRLATEQQQARTSEGQLSVARDREAREKAESDLRQQQLRGIGGPGTIPPPPGATPPAGPAATPPTAPGSIPPPPSAPPGSAATDVPPPGVQVAGPGGASAPSGPVPTMPGTPADVQAILTGVQGAQAAPSERGAQTAQATGAAPVTAPDSSDPDFAKAYRKPTLPPELTGPVTIPAEQHQALYQAEQDARKRLDLDGVRAAQKAYADAVGHAADQQQKAQQEWIAKDRDQQFTAWQSHREPATQAQLQRAGIVPEAGVYYEADRFGNLQPKQIPVDARLQNLATSDKAIFDKDYQPAYIANTRLRPVMEQMDALHRQLLTDPAGTGGIVGDAYRKFASAMSGAGLAWPGMREGVSNAEAYNALAQQVVGALKANITLGNVSDRDLQFVKDQAPSLSMTPAGREKLSAMIKQLWDHQERVYHTANETLHDRATGYSFGSGDNSLQTRIAKLPPAIPTQPPMEAGAPEHAAFVKQMKRGTVYYDPKGVPQIWGQP